MIITRKEAMKIHQQKVAFFLLMTVLCTLLMVVESRDVLAQVHGERAIYYQKLNHIKQKPDSMIISVGNQKFIITKETPILFKRARKLFKKKVQVIYNKKNHQVINLFSDFRQTPR